MLISSDAVLTLHAGQKYLLTIRFSMCQVTGSAELHPHESIEI
jgi:hypothetical protein